GHAVPSPLRQRPRQGRLRLDRVLHGARLRVRPEVHRRQLRLPGRQRAGLRDAARRGALRRLHDEADRRRPHVDRGADLRVGRGPRRRRRARRRGPRGRRLAREGRDGLRLHVRPLLPGPRRPPLGGHVDERRGRRAGPRRHGAGPGRL
ncbi:MAG: Glyoxalase family protein, partial [uncultured Solirubrobacteraceae bacterium]